MLVLVKLKRFSTAALTRETYTPRAGAYALYNAVAQEFNEFLSSNPMYYAESAESEEAAVAAVRYGVSEPDEVKAIVSNWNNNIVDRLKVAMKCLLHGDSVESGTIDLDNADTDSLSEIISMASVLMCRGYVPVANQLVFIHNADNRTVSHLLPQGEIGEILANIGDYAIVDLKTAS